MRYSRVHEPLLSFSTQITPHLLPFYLTHVHDLVDVLYTNCLSDARYMPKCSPSLRDSPANPLTFPVSGKISSLLHLCSHHIGLSLFSLSSESLCPALQLPLQMAPSSNSIRSFLNIRSSIPSRRASQLD